MKRLVVDASTLVSGVASRPGGGAPWLILVALLDFDFEAIVCPKLIGEFRGALTNKYFRERFNSDLAEIVSNVEEAASKYPDPEEIAAVLRDPDDDYLVALAREAGADAIITGDRDLLDHPDLQPEPFAALRQLTSSQVLNRRSGSSSGSSSPCCAISSASSARVSVSWAMTLVARARS